MAVPVAQRPSNCRRGFQSTEPGTPGRDVQTTLDLGRYFRALMTDAATAIPSTTPIRMNTATMYGLAASRPRSTPAIMNDRSAPRLTTARRMATVDTAPPSLPLGCYALRIPPPVDYLSSTRAPSLCGPAYRFYCGYYRTIVRCRRRGRQGHRAPGVPE